LFTAPSSRARGWLWFRLRTVGSQVSAVEQRPVATGQQSENGRYFKHGVVSGELSDHGRYFEALHCAVHCAGASAGRRRPSEATVEV
jgi:hypothetical protein